MQKKPHGLPQVLLLFGRFGKQSFSLFKGIIYFTILYYPLSFLNFLHILSQEIISQAGLQLPNKQLTLSSTFTALMSFLGSRFLHPTYPSSFTCLKLSSKIFPKHMLSSPVIHSFIHSFRVTGLQVPLQ